MYTMPRRLNGLLTLALLMALGAGADDKTEPPAKESEPAAAIAPASAKIVEVGLSDSEMRAALDKLVAGLRLVSAPFDGKTGLFMLEAGESYDEVTVRGDAGSMPWLENAKTGWLAVACDGNGGYMVEPMRAIDSTMRTNEERVARQAMIDAKLKKPTLDLSDLWQSHDLHADYSLVSGDMTLQFHVKRNSLDVSIGELRGAIGWRIPTKTAVFEFPLAGPYEEKSADRVRCKIVSNVPIDGPPFAKKGVGQRAVIFTVRSARNLTQTSSPDGPVAEILRPKVIGIAESGGEVPLNLIDTYLPNPTDSNSTQSFETPAFFVVFDPLVTRIRIETPLDYFNYSARLKLNPSSDAKSVADNN